MDLGSFDKYSEDIGQLQEDDDSAFAMKGELDLNFEMDKGGEGHGHKFETWGDRVEMELNQQEHRGVSSVSADLEHERPTSPYEKSYSQVEYKEHHVEEMKEEFERSYSFPGDTEISNSERDYKTHHVEEMKEEFDFDKERSYSFPGETEKFNSQEDYKAHYAKEMNEEFDFDKERSNSFPGETENSNSRVDRKAHNVEEMREEFDFDKERSYAFPGENEMEHDGFYHKPVYPVDVEIQNELEVGDPAQFSLNSPSKMDSVNQQGDGEEDNSTHHDRGGKFAGNLQIEKTEPVHEVMGRGSAENLIGKSFDGNGTEKEDLHSGKPPSDKGKLDGISIHARSSETAHRRSSSPLREMPLSPKKDHEIQGAVDRKLPFSPQGQDLSHPSPGLPRQKHSASPERPRGDSKRDFSQDRPSLPARRTSASPARRSRRESPRRNDSVLKSASPRRRHLSPDRRRHERSVSRSPTRQRDTSSGYRRDYRDRLRSRSPNAPDRYRRSPRRYSPRRRSPPSGYHSRRRSPRRRPWSPPRNRNNGVGRPGNNLFVAGFSFVTTERDLERKFSRFGRVRDVRIVRDKRSGDSRGFGFLSLERDEDADAAIRALDQTEWNGRVVLVEKSKSR